MNPNASRSLRIAIVLLFASNGLSISSWIVHIPLLKERLGLNDEMLGLALLGAGLGSLSTMWISSWLMSRYSSRTIATVSGVLFPLSLLGPAFANSFWSLAISLLALGAANGLMDIAMNSQAALYESLLGRPVMSSFHACWSLSCWFGSFCGSLFLATPTSTMIHLPVIALAGAILTLSADRALVQTGPKKQTNSIIVLPTGILAVLGLLCLMVMMSEGAVADWAGVQLRGAYHVSEAASVFGYNAFAFCMTIGRFAGDRLAHGFGRRNVIIISAAISAVGLALAALAPGPAIAIIGFGIAGCGMANLVPLLFSLAAARAGAEVEHATSSVFATGYIGFLIGPPLVGFISGHTSLPGALLCLSVGLLGVASTVFRLNGAERVAQQEPTS